MDGNIFFSSLSLPLYSPSGRAFAASIEGCRSWEAGRLRGRFGNPTQTSVCNDRVSEIPWGMGGSGLSFGCRRRWASAAAFIDARLLLFVTLRRRVRLGATDVSESSLELDVEIVGL